jgi:hypothetical protein
MKRILLILLFVTSVCYAGDDDYMKITPSSSSGSSSDTPWSVDHNANGHSLTGLLNLTASNVIQSYDSSGSGNPTFELKRDGAFAADWSIYLAGFQTDLHFYSATKMSDAFVLGDTNSTLSTNLSLANNNLTTTGTLGCGALTATSAIIGSGFTTSSKQYYAPQATCTTTLDWANGNCQKIQLASGNNTFTFANPQTGARYLLRLKQPGSGGAGTVTWPVSGLVHWPAATAPTLTTTNNQIDIICFYYDGTSYFGAASLNYAP